MASKRNEKKLSSLTELTSLVEDKAIKIIEIGQRDKDRDKDNRDREREWTFKNNHVNNNHQQSKLINHTSHVSIMLFFFCI